MLDGSSSWTPHTETWHCAESSFSKSIFVDTTFWLKQRPDQKWVFSSCWFFSFPIVLAIFLLPKAIFNCVIVFKHFYPFLELFQDFFFNLIVICFSLPYSFSIFKIVGSCNCLKVSLMRGLLGPMDSESQRKKARGGPLLGCLVRGFFTVWVTKMLLCVWMRWGSEKGAVQGHTAAGLVPLSPVLLFHVWAEMVSRWDYVSCLNLSFACFVFSDVYVRVWIALGTR